jgi:hypothetical protein
LFGIAENSRNSAFFQQYAIIDVSILFTLLLWWRSGCKRCFGELYAVSSEWTGHCLSITLQCGACGHSDTWDGSKKYGDGSFQINRDVVRCWYTTGGEDGHYQDFTTQLKAGTYSRAQFDSTVNLIIPIIHQKEDKMYSTNIDQANQNGDGTIIGVDVQHCRSQRADGPAPLATATVINHTPGAQYGQILIQTHQYKYDMLKEGIKSTASKDKLTTKEALKIMANKLNKIKRGICDGLGSTKVLWDSIIHSLKHGKPLLTFCEWHKTKNLVKDFKKKLLEHKTKLKEKKGNQQYESTYPQIEELGITGEKIKSQWIRAQKKIADNDLSKFVTAADVMEMEWMNTVDYFDSQVPFDTKTKEAFEDWLGKQAKDIERYVYGDKTDLEEAFHRTSLKYWKKGRSYSKENYIARRALAAMHWNENYGKEKNTYKFLEEIRKEVDNMFDQRRTGRKAKNEYKVSKSGIITHWPKKS